MYCYIHLEKKKNVCLTNIRHVYRSHKLTTFITDASGKIVAENSTFLSESWKKIKTDL